MRIATFILSHMENILAEWESFAATLLPAAGRLDSAALRDHAESMLRTIAADLSSEQSGEEQRLKSHGLAPDVAGAPETAAQTHATLRAQDGFDINQMTAEYRALRASVLRLWLAESSPAPEDLQDIIRFNEAIDQALTESIRDFTVSLDRSRNLLLGMLGHDMRNPLSVMVTTANYLSQLNAGDKVSAASARLIKSGARMAALVGDLVDFSRTQLGVGIHVVPAAIDLAEVFREQVDLQQAVHPEQRLTLEVSGDVVGAWDGNRIHQVLGNLISNAVKYGDPDTSIEVKLVGNAERVSFSVGNDGPVISEPIGDIFDPLTRGGRTAKAIDQTDSGMGLGLFICREIVEAHDGHISVRSNDARTVFSIELPRKPAHEGCRKLRTGTANTAVRSGSTGGVSGVAP